jgi:hypothetical protein
VTNRDPELAEVAPDERFLRRLAGLVDGRFVGPGDPVEPLRDPESGRVVWDRRATPLWRAPLFALLAGALAGLAWIVRRRSGLR